MSTRCADLEVRSPSAITLIEFRTGKPAVFRIDGEKGSDRVGRVIRSPVKNGTIVVLESLLVAAAYVAGAQIGFKLAFLHSQVSPVWPPEGISLAAVLVRGYRVTGGVILGAFLANFLNNPHLPTAGLIAAGNTLSVLTAAFLIHKLTGSNNPFSRARHVLRFLTIGTMPGAAVSAFIGVTSLYFFGFVPAEAYVNVVLTWWTGEMQGLVIIAPFLFAWSRAPRIQSVPKGRVFLRLLEAFVLLASLTGAGFLVFHSVMPLSYLPLPFMLWAVFRFQLKGGTTATIIVSFVATYFTVNQTGPFAHISGEQISMNTSLLFLELYIGSLTVLTLVVAATVTERAEALASQEAVASELRDQSEAFYRFVPAGFLRILGKKSALDIQLGDTREGVVTVLFSDVRSYTTISENLTPTENIELLNAYLARMEPVIHSHGGFVDKFIGDAIMALFDEGRGSETSSDRAVACAVEMRRTLQRFNELRAKTGRQPLDCGIGISTGLVVLGTVGSLERLDTTAIGDTVNLAARLETLTARFGLPVLVSTSTMNTMNHPERFQSRMLGTVTMKGKRRPVEIHEVFDTDPPELAEKKRRSADLIAQAFPLYVGREFARALELYEQARLLHDELLLGQYIERCKGYMVVPPPEDWNGSEVLREK